MGPRLLLVVNASATRVRDPANAREQAQAALERAGASVDAHVTESVDEFAALVRGAADRRVVLLGGDGTLHEAVNVAEDTPELALVPAGGANNVATVLGIPTELEAAAQLAATGRPHRLDLIEARRGNRRRIVVEGASVGVHAVARARYRSRTSTDFWAAARAAWSGVRGFRGTSIVLDTDGVLHAGRIAQVFVANFPLYGFGLQVEPHARPDDGLLDVVVHGWSGRTGLLPLFVRLRLGRSEASTWTAERIRIDTGRSPLICDTENLGHGRAELAVLPRALTLVAP
jgi:diacylglycerol kinase (ATP)